VPDPNDAVADVERRILLREVLDLLSEDERRVCFWKKVGFSSEEIAARRGGSAAAVDTLFSRAKQKIRVALGYERSRVAGRPGTVPGAEPDAPSTTIKEAHVRPRAAS
jgi:DNA-directed RNA polymerase specialized sigma24 family protein